MQAEGLPFIGLEAVENQGALTNLRTKGGVTFEAATLPAFLKALLTQGQQAQVGSSFHLLANLYGAAHWQTVPNDTGNSSAKAADRRAILTLIRAQFVESVGGHVQLRANKGV